jgi:dTDP-4-dehydrorhamnose 3,5-epimerase
MQYRATSLAGVMILTPTTFSDHRGQFRECFRQAEFEQHCGNYPLVQDNLSRSVGGHVARLALPAQQTTG